MDRIKCVSDCDGGESPERSVRGSLSRRTTTCEQLCELPGYEALLACIAAGGDRTSCLPAAKEAQAQCQDACRKKRDYLDKFAELRRILGEE